ncbi:division/cell wall cluster transcriptional repressor MraZ [Methyloterricola oryzae]|uniref:division/cell wall cluster transcriptional repressor MraZ n=1 Tax=Methyloterricola oryzae TaxID=1495050 RepID=UPI0005EB5F9B|nr:division/cell wall cluster transcriptional repressor MraZ [Methyloterricola oryzae]
MFRGVNSINLDEKGRLAIPTRYRAELQECCERQLVLTVGLDRCLMLYPFPEWEDIERKLVKLPSLNKQAKRLQRLLIGHATECEMDSQGRVLIAEPLRKFANLDKRVVLTGQGNKFEIWDEDVWNRSRDEWLEEEGVEDLDDLSPELESLSF